jgi:hypothetical protein
MVNWLVHKVHLNVNDSVVLIVEVGDFGPGNWAEISGYITQESGAFTPFSAVQKVTLASDGTPIVTVNVPSMGLVPGEDLRVITRVAEVQAWPTVLGAGVAEKDVQATWLAKDTNPGPASHPQWSGQSGLVSRTTSTGMTGSGTPVAVTGPNGTKVTVTVETVAPSEPQDTDIGQ